MNIPSLNLLLQSITHNQNQNNIQPTHTIIMCRGFQENERESLKIRAFYTHFSLSATAAAAALPDSLTLHFLPRINGTLLQINGSTVRPDSPAFVTLHRVLGPEEAGRGFKYGSRERVVVCEGARFEIYVGDVKVLKGIFRKDEGDNWKMECKCVLSANGVVVKGVQAAEVAVAAEGLGGVMSEKVEMVVPAERRRRRRRGRCCEMEEIPEVREEEAGPGPCCCSECCGRGLAAEDGGDCEMEVDVEAVRWAVDVGIWAVCFGVGYMVSASSFKRLRRKKFV